MDGNLEWYRAFYRTAKAGSFSKAAEELHLTQPAISHAIRQLEARLGGPLFFRGPKGVRLTAEGEALYLYVAQAYHLLDMGEKKLAEMQQLMCGELKIGAGDTLCKHVLLPKLSEFHHTYPDVRIQVMNRTSADTVQLLKEGHIELGIVNLPLPDDPQLHIHDSMELQDGFVAGPAYQSLANRLLEPEELFREPLLLLEQGSSMRRYVDQYAKDCGCEVHTAIELGSIDLLVSFARRGLGLASVILPFVQEELNSGALFEVKPRVPIAPRRAGIIHLRGVPLSASAKKLLDMLLEIG